MGRKARKSKATVAKEQRERMRSRRQKVKEDNAGAENTILEQNTKNTMLEQNTKNTMLEQNTKNTMLEQNTKNTMLEQNTKNTMLEQNTKNTMLEQNTNNTMLEQNTKNTMLEQNTNNTMPEQNAEHDMNELNAKLTMQGINAENNMQKLAADLNAAFNAKLKMTEILLESLSESKTENHSFMKLKPNILTNTEHFEINLNTFHAQHTTPLILQGRFHQADARFGSNGGKQCVANSLLAIVSSKLRPISHWDKDFLDQILIQGNELYTWIHGNNSELLVTELPDIVEVGGILVKCYRKESFGAIIDSGRIDFSELAFVLPLDQCLQAALIDSDGCFVCVNGFTSIVIKQGGRLYLFDSHARSAQGLSDINGTSVVIEFENINDIYQFLCNFVQHSDNVQFEVTGITIEIDQTSVLPTRDCSVSQNVNDYERKIAKDSVSLISGNNKHADWGCETFCFEECAVVGNTNPVQFDFKPTDATLRRKLCSVLKIPAKNVSKSGNFSPVFNMGVPHKTKSIQGDGNCLFRALAFAVSQRQDYHLRVREAIVQHSLLHEEKFMSFIDPTPVSEHITNTKMLEDGSWGTAFEIIVAADLLETDIYTFTDGQWLKFSAHQVRPDCVVNDKSIYLKNCNNHFEVVTSVQQSYIPNNYLVHKNVEQKCKPSFLNLEAETFQLCNSESNTMFYGSPIKKSKVDKEKEKYKSESEFRERKLLKKREKYAVFKQEVNDCRRKRYKYDINYQNSLKRKLKDKYTNNAGNRDIKKKQSKIQSKTKYESSVSYRLTKRNAIINKYATDKSYRQKAKDASVKKYATNETHKQKAKDASVKKYATNKTHKQKAKDASKTRYSVNKALREKIKRQTTERRNKTKEELTKIENVIHRFRVESKNGPEYVCSCCFRLFFAKQVIVCNKDVYRQKGENVGNLSKLCISNKYVHQCSTECLGNCRYAETSRAKLWICFTCHRKLLIGKIPAECHVNNLQLEEIPSELNSLNNLEKHLVALNIPFMKILALPKGGQKGVQGPVVCVPSNLSKLTSSLPRSEDENCMIPVKLKRKISYKGYEEYQYVSTKRLDGALNYLKQNNTWYTDVQLAKHWLNPIPEETCEEISPDSSIESVVNDTAERSCDQNEMKEFQQLVSASEHASCTKECTTDKTEGIENENNYNCVHQNSNKCVQMSDDSESYLDDGLRGVQLDTCLQPADIGQEMLDLCFDQVFNISPAEGNKPVSVLKEDGIEAKSFPVYYPSGKNTLTDEREDKLSLLRYFNLRLMCVDNRFAKDASYIFFSQYLSELDRVISNVQIALRKESPVTADGKEVTSSMLCNKECLKDLLKKDQAIKYLKPIRGTPPYWQSTQKDIFAMIRQLGIPTFFCSFSSADFRWTEMVETVMKQQGDTRNAEMLDWKEKCRILYSNPVTLARMFDHKFHAFLHEVILSDAQPIGKVVDYFYRVEFQQRGSPHVHCLFWIENAPKFGIDSDSNVVQFIDRYITCEIPDKEEDPELNEIVTSVHQHSKNHSKTCKKKGTVCRFNFPRPPSTKTFISQPKECEENQESEETKAKQRLSELWECLLDSTNADISTEEVFQKINMTQVEFEDVFALVSKRNAVVLKRQTKEVYTNQYNKHLLRAWNANMDIQYVLDAYSCVVYIISYISKAERELGLLLQQTKVEAGEGNLDAQQTMKKIGTAYLHHREISVQEAVYRVTGLRLKECSRKVEFVPVGVNPCRISVPLQELERISIKKKFKSSEDSQQESSMWMTNSVDRYKERPKTETFEQKCLATFCSGYSVLAKSQIPAKLNAETTFKLGKELGYIRKRTRTQPAVIRYPRFSVEASPEKYYQSILQLFLPYRQDQQLKPPQFETFEEFYKSGFVKYNDSSELQNVKCIVDRNRLEFNKENQALDNAERDLEERGFQEDAWGRLFSEAEVERHECNLEGSSSTVIEDDVTDESIPDLNKSDKQSSSNLIFTPLYPKNEIVPLLRTMNTKQRQVFYKIRDWCLRKANGGTVEPFYVFITGGGGTGKSQLIKCLYYEMTRLLSKTSDNPDDVTVLLTAPTGTAAFNISGLTIHSALSIYKSLSPDHAVLSEDKINTLRSKLESLQVLIIDEISMVNKRLLFFIHERLRQVKKMPEEGKFGGVSVIAVGDFYQLPPVKTKKTDKLYFNDPSNPMNHLWNELFEVVELDEIMRQRNDSQFSEMLNRLRIKSKSDIIEHNDLCTLKQCIGNGSENAMHIFPTNEEVKKHNNEMVLKLESEVMLIEAEDFEKIKTSGHMIRKKSNFPDKDLQLPSSLLLGNGARVLLTRNIDTEDGLVNGVMGTVTEIIQNVPNSMPQKIFIHFDNSKVGKNAKSKKCIGGETCIGIEPCTEDVPKRNGNRRQFPLQLAWACTVHKVQGLTVQECVVDLNKCFTCGQAYVALSRVTSLSGLHVKEIDESTLRSKIYCDPDVADGISKMKRFLTDLPPVMKMNKMVLLYHNIQGLLNHFEDLKANPDVNNADCICLTETWLKEGMDCSFEGYNFRHLSRSEAFESKIEFFRTLKEMQHGGVGIFLKNGLDFEEGILPFQNLECCYFRILSLNIFVVTVYRTQKYPVKKFLEYFSDLMERLLSVSDKIIVVGDFNEDIRKGETVTEKYMKSIGFVQRVQSATTELGTLIDHVYLKGIRNIEVSVLPTYYSYHEAILLQITY